jgi:rhodanese-related sulfurtransferase
LAVKSDLTQADLAGHLFDSLHTKIMPLADDVIVYPAHGAGSACGKNMSKETFATLGHQKEYNYALKINDKEQFIKEVTHGLVAPPQYFPKNVMMNKNGYDSIDSVVERGIQKLTPDEFEKAAEHALILDVRHQKDFIESHIPQSMFIGLDGQFAVWVGTLIEDIQQPIILVAPAGREREAVIRLARVGYDNVQGYLDGGLTAWKQAGKSTDMLESISAQEFGNRLNNDTIFTVDVRKQSEYMSEHVIDVRNSPLDLINKEFIDIPENQPAYIHCAGGYRSVIAASILKRKGIHNLIDVAGGYAAIKASGSVNVTEYVCPTTML